MKVDIKKEENNELIHWKLVIPISSKNCCDEVCKKYQELKDFHTNGKPPNQCIGYTYHTTGKQCMIKSTVKSSQRTEKAKQTGSKYSTMFGYNLHLIKHACWRRVECI